MSDMALQKVKPYGKVSIYFWRQKNRVLETPQVTPTPYFTKPRRSDKSILSNLPWNFKEDFHMEKVYAAEGRKRFPMKPRGTSEKGVLR